MDFWYRKGGGWRPLLCYTSIFIIPRAQVSQLYTEGEEQQKEKNNWKHFKVPFRIVRGWVLRPKQVVSTAIRKILDCSSYIDEFFQVLIQIGQVVFSSLVLSNKLLFSLQKLLASLFQYLSLFPLVLDTCKHALVVICICILWVQGQKLFDRNKRQLLVFVTRVGKLAIGRSNVNLPQQQQRYPKRRRILV